MSQNPKCTLSRRPEGFDGHRPVLNELGKSGTPLCWHIGTRMTSACSAAGRVAFFPRRTVPVVVFSRAGIVCPMTVCAHAELFRRSAWRRGRGWARDAGQFHSAHLSERRDASGCRHANVLLKCRVFRPCG